MSETEEEEINESTFDVTRQINLRRKIVKVKGRTTKKFVMNEQSERTPKRTTRYFNDTSSSSSSSNCEASENEQTEHETTEDDLSGAVELVSSTNNDDREIGNVFTENVEASVHGSESVAIQPSIMATQFAENEMNPVISNISMSIDSNNDDTNSANAHGTY